MAKALRWIEGQFIDCLFCGDKFFAYVDKNITSDKGYHIIFYMPVVEEIYYEGSNFQAKIFCEFKCITYMDEDVNLTGAWLIPDFVEIIRG